MERDKHTDSEIKEFYSLKNVAVVGMSKNDGKASNYVPRYLMDHGFNVIPVNPTAPEILGRKSYSRVSEISGPVDIVDVFRPSEAVADVVKDAVQKAGIKLIWMQEGIYNPEGEKIARQEGIDVVYNRCMMAEHERLFGE